MSDEYIPPKPKESDEWTIYSTKWCGPCKNLKKYMAEHEIDYVGYDLGDAENTGLVLEEFEDITSGYEHIPMVFHNAKFIGGFSDFKKYYKNIKKDEENVSDPDN